VERHHPDIPIAAAVEGHRMSDHHKRMIGCRLGRLAGVAGFAVARGLHTETTTLIFSLYPWIVNP
jgi:hypothetical protein